MEGPARSCKVQAGCPSASRFSAGPCGFPANGRPANWPSEHSVEPKVTERACIFLAFPPFRLFFLRVTPTHISKSKTCSSTGTSPPSRTRQRLLTYSELARFKTALMKGRLSIFTSQVCSVGDSALSFCQGARVLPTPPSSPRCFRWPLSRLPGLRVYGFREPHSRVYHLSVFSMTNRSLN